MNSNASLKKFIRFAFIYGLSRAIFKASGRLRLRLPTLNNSSKPRDIAIVGCGQFAFATIGYFLQRAYGHRLLGCFDTDPLAAATLARCLEVPHQCANIDDLLSLSGLRTVYVASNHASHATYAARALSRGLDVYVEKPVAVTPEQLKLLLQEQRSASGRLFAGYNRPFSGAVRWLREQTPVDEDGGITLQCCVSGHKLDADHWYRRPDEGTRVCGNIGHWLDLMVHVFSWRGMPDGLDISLTWADAAEPDDNVNISIASDRGDLFSVTLTSRSEPFEGIREVIHFQHGETTAEIEDFRRITLWQGARRSRKRFWPKDVGHQRAILQPFAVNATRDWHEVELSTLLMLHITAMVRGRERSASFSFRQAWQQLEEKLRDD